VSSSFLPSAVYVELTGDSAGEKLVSAKSTTSSVDRVRFRREHEDVSFASFELSMSKEKRSLPPFQSINGSRTGSTSRRHRLNSISPVETNQNLRFRSHFNRERLNDVYTHNDYREDHQGERRTTECISDGASSRGRAGIGKEIGFIALHKQRSEGSDGSEGADK